MDITITTQNVLEDMRLKSHLEVENIEDVDIRDNARADLLKSDELERAFTGSLADLGNLLARFLTDATVTATATAGNAPGVEESYRYEFTASERRYSGKVRLIADKMHSYVVNMALSRFYVSVGQANLSAAHANLAASDGAALVTALYSKSQPSY